MLALGLYVWVPYLKAGRGAIRLLLADDESALGLGLIEARQHSVHQLILFTTHSLLICKHNTAIQN